MHFKIISAFVVARFICLVYISKNSYHYHKYLIGSKIVEFYSNQIYCCLFRKITWLTLQQ